MVVTVLSVCLLPWLVVSINHGDLWNQRRALIAYFGSSAKYGLLGIGPHATKEKINVINNRHSHMLLDDRKAFHIACTPL